jgi:hypothetical protein
MAGSKSRETRIVAAVECPRCHARPGLACYIQGRSTLIPVGTGVKPACHPERKAAWQELKRQQGGA